MEERNSTLADKGHDMIGKKGGDVLVGNIPNPLFLLKRKGGFVCGKRKGAE